MLKKSYLYIFITGALFISCQNSKQDSTQAEKSDSTTQAQAQTNKETSESQPHNGTKKVSRYSYEETEPCILCEGTGKAIYECPTCEGSGRTLPSINEEVKKEISIMQRDSMDIETRNAGLENKEQNEDVEKLAREKYGLHTPQEEVYVIE